MSRQPLPGFYLWLFLHFWPLRSFCLSKCFKNKIRKQEAGRQGHVNRQEVPVLPVHAVAVLPVDHYRVENFVFRQ